MNGRDTQKNGQMQKNFVNVLCQEKEQGRVVTTQGGRKNFFDI